MGVMNETEAVVGACYCGEPLVDRALNECLWYEWEKLTCKCGRWYWVEVREDRVRFDGPFHGHHLGERNMAIRRSDMEAGNLHCLCGAAILAPASTEWKRSECPCGFWYWTRWSKSKPGVIYIDGPFDLESIEWWKKAPRRKLNRD